jgi:NADH-quinone oxidoreductase subunit E
MSEPSGVGAPLFSNEELKRFEAEVAEILTHYPPDRKSAAMLPVLRVVQSMKGWLPPEGIALAARRSASPSSARTRSRPST